MKITNYKFNFYIEQYWRDEKHLWTDISSISFIEKIQQQGIFKILYLHNFFLTPISKFPNGSNIVLWTIALILR